MIKKLLCLFLLYSGMVLGQEIELSPKATVSVLTMGPGQSLYDSFGHSAIRLRDQGLGIDVVYNYGVYDFTDPNFYTKFAKGNMSYLLDRKPTAHFLSNYIDYNRWVKEQLLALSPKEAQQLFEFLENNLKPENRAYNYDFFYDNCATKVPEVIGKVISGGIIIDPTYLDEQKTFRTLIQENVHWNTWGSFGMDIGIGSVTDKIATANEHMFLPENVFLAFQKATRDEASGGIPLVMETKDLFVNNPIPPRGEGLKSPLVLFGLLGILILFFTYRDYKKQERSRWLDVSLAIITGVVGIILLLLWFATDHSTTANNYNVLWAFPFNVFIVLQLLKKQPKKWLGRYMRFLIILLALLTLHWIIGVQVFAKALIPLLVALALRYIYVVKYLGSLPSVEDNRA
ncbi:MAG: DUF4105 domain-containing protein [Gilvibacter sp.]